MANPNPNWPSFPGLANQTQDGDGRPQVLDLIPGKQRGTPLNSLLFNPLIRSVCDLRDTADNLRDSAGDLISGVQGVDASAGDMRGLGWFWQGVSDAPCFIFMGPEGKTVFKAVVTREQVDSWRANLASNDALNSEISRAKNAENDRLSGVQGVDASAGDMRGLGWFWQGVSDAPCFIFMGPDGKTVFKAVVTREQVDSWLANLATKDALNAEISRAKNAENGKLSRTGDTTSGNVIFNSGNQFASWATSPQSIYQIGSAIMSIWGQVDGAGNIQLVLGGNNPGQPYQTPWVFNPNKRIAFTPSGNVLMESGDTSAPRMRQCFRVQAKIGDLISWPKAFSRPDGVFATFTCADSGNGRTHYVNYAPGITPGQFNVLISVLAWDGSYMVGEKNPITIDVTVEGYA